MGPATRGADPYGSPSRVYRDRSRFEGIVVDKEARRVEISLKKHGVGLTAEAERYTGNCLLPDATRG